MSGEIVSKTTENIEQVTGGTGTGVDIQAQYQYVGFWKRLLATLIDIVFLLPFLFLNTQIIQLFTFQEKTIMPVIIFNLILNVAYLFFIVKFGGTPGKLLFRIRIVNQFGSYISIKNALLRQAIFIFSSLLNVYAVSVAMHNYLPYELPTSFYDTVLLTLKYNPNCNLIQNIIQFIFYIDVLAILFNKKKRALHDYIAGSYVIKKQP